MKRYLYLPLLAVLLLSSGNTFAQQQQVPPVDRMIVLMEKVKDGIRHVDTTILDFSDSPSTLSECRKLADDYEDFTSLDGMVICYYKGRRLADYKI